MKHKRYCWDRNTPSMRSFSCWRIKHTRSPFVVFVVIMVMTFVLYLQIFKNTFTQLPRARQYLDTVPTIDTELMSPLVNIVRTPSVDNTTPIGVHSSAGDDGIVRSTHDVVNDPSNVGKSTGNAKNSEHQVVKSRVQMSIGVVKRNNSTEVQLPALVKGGVVKDKTANEASVVPNMTNGLEPRTRKPKIKPTTIPNPFCKPTGLVGRMRVVPSLNVSVTKFKDHTDIQPGGWWTPPCLARHKVAIIIPYRDRQHHLFTLLFYLIPVLKRQLVEFRIFVVEQKGNHTFNKGIIMNAAFKEAVRLSEYHCYIFHDVDLIPEDDRNLYTCPGLPRHLSVAVDKFGYRLPYTRLVGGVFAIRRADFEMVNGYSNLYWGWGAEDDDMSIRLSIAGLPIERPSATVARYKMLKHKGRVHAPGKWIDYLLKTVKKRFYNDGLNTVNYNVTFVHLDRLFTHVMVDIGRPPTIVGNISAIIR